MKHNTIKRVLNSFLIILFIIALIPYASAFFGKRETKPDILTSFAKSTVIGEELCFNKNEFISKATKNATLDGIIICDLPDPNIGVLKFDGRDLQRGEALTVDGIDDIRFVPYSMNAESAFFSFMPVFKNGGNSKTVKVGLNVLNMQNSPPSATDVSVVTSRNIAISGAFSASDPEGDELNYTILDKPTLGNVEVCVDNPSKFIYKPFLNKTGNDSFTYVAVDSLGNTSEPATVSIKIEKPRFKLSYSDMVEDGMHYPAIVLAEKGVFKGENIGGECFLYPSKNVTRSEFIAMVAALFNIEADKNIVDTMGFADDNNTPAWAKPYILSAVKQGIITGGDHEGVMMLRPRDVLTRGEAAIVINNAIELTDVALNDNFSRKTTPVWARQAAANTLENNILTRCSDGSLGLNRRVTRVDAIELLYNTMLLLDGK